MKLSITPFLLDRSSVMNINRHHHNSLISIVRHFMRELKRSESANNILVVDFHEKGQPILKNHSGKPYTVSRLLSEIYAILTSFSLKDSYDTKSQVSRATIYRCMLIDNIMLLDKIILSLDSAAIHTDPDLKKRVQKLSTSLQYATQPLKRHNILLNFGRIIMVAGIITVIYIGYFFTLYDMDENSLGFGVLGLLLILSGYSLIQNAKEKRMKSAIVLEGAKKYARYVAGRFVKLIEKRKSNINKRTIGFNHEQAQALDNKSHKTNDSTPKLH